LVASKEWENTSGIKQRLLTLLNTSDGIKSKSNKVKRGRSSTVEACRMKEVGNKDTLERNGIMYHWFPHHVQEVKYNGLYVFHSHGEHGNWQINKDKSKLAKKNKPCRNKALKSRNL